MKTDYRCVRLTGGFWKTKEDLNRDVTIPAVYDRFVETGRIDAFRCDWKPGMPNQPHFFWDSDVAKWMESAAYVLSREDVPGLRDKIETLIDCIEQNQGEDGYFNIYFTVVAPDKRFTVRDWHELYCAGHLMEAACAYFGATGSDRFLKIMEKYADYITKVFMIDKSAPYRTPGHEEIELALFKMYRTTGKKKFFELAQFFLENRGQPDNDEKQIFDEAHYAQSHAPIRRQREAAGHSVRAMYLYSGMTDLAEETGDEELLSACRDLFEDTVNRKMYITGGIGSTNIGEAFTIPYDLPNSRAYTETCASLGLMFFANRMLKADPEHPSKYADIVELEMYNGALSGLSLDGEKFFYENPLEIYMTERRRITATHDHEHWPITQRVRMFGCSCCPPNLNRVLASLGEYFYAWDEKTGKVYVNQFGSSTFAKDGMTVTQTTDYPFSGRVEIRANVPICVRIPGWCRSFTADAPYDMVNGYASFGPGCVTVEFDMKPELAGTNVGVVRNIGQAALRRGPVVYCVEGVDHEGDLHTLTFDRKKAADAKIDVNDVSGLPVLTVEGWRRLNVSDDLYAPLEEKFEPAVIRCIPYSSFANRGETDMLVFLSYR
ncbi:MAG: glycoside hydrolase family 127 protein [Clostridia bacterium]|nr:glycoside hydrolase family 127 protein [Clostridia bacterium]